MEQYSRTRHPGTAELLDYLDDSCRGEIVRHISSCSECLQALDKIRDTREALQRLPGRRPTESAWPAIQAELSIKSEKVNASPGKVWWLSLAASVLLVSALMFQLMPPQIEPDNTEFYTLMDENRNLESAVAYLDSRQIAMNLGTAGRIARLKDNITVLDMAINEGFESEDADKFRTALMKERIRLMRGLVEAQAQPMLASYRAF